MPRPRRIRSVFLNIPYDAAFESLYLAYIVGLTQLGLRINVTLAVPNQGRLETIINLIEHSDFSIHDLSRTEASRGVPRFNMPVELGLALYRSHVANGRHAVFIFESRRYRAQRSTSDVTTVPEMLASYGAVKRKLPELRRNAGGKSLFEAAVFEDITFAALVESQKLRGRRAGRHSES